MDESSSPRFIRLPEVSRLTGFGKTTIYQRARKDLNFPKPVKISSRMTVWRADEVVAWVEARTAVSRSSS